MNTLSFCITSYYRDIHHLERLFKFLSQQTNAPNEILLYCSGVMGIQVHNNITICNKQIPIRTIIDRKPQLQTVARNKCADLASCDIVSFFDVDDIPHPQKIESILYHIKNYDFLVHSYKRDMSEFIYFDVENMTKTDQIRKNPNPKSTNLQVIPERPITHGHLTVRKNIFSRLRYDENFYFVNTFGQKVCSGEDGKFCQKLVDEGYTGIFLDEPLIIYT